MLQKMLKFIKSNEYRFGVLEAIGIWNSLSDETFLKKKFKVKVGMNLNLTNVITFNQKIQWLKLYDRRIEYTMMVDKYRVREYITDKIGDEYLIPLLGVWDNPDNIDFSKLPKKFVLKCNHNSGLGMCICENKDLLNLKNVKKKLKKGIKQNYYLTGREWPYKNVKRRIIAEMYMDDSQKKELMDYKFMCFNGRVECIFVCSDRFSNNGLKVTFFDKQWNILPFERHYPKSDTKISKPFNLEKMIKLAEVLSKGIPFVRVDLYEIKQKIYFGELTFSPGSGMERFTPLSADYNLGRLIELPKVQLIETE